LETKRSDVAVRRGSERVTDRRHGQADHEEADHAEREQSRLEPAGTVDGALAPGIVASVGQG